MFQKGEISLRQRKRCREIFRIIFKDFIIITRELKESTFCFAVVLVIVDIAIAQSN
jgi:hypothetical protein